MRNAQKPDHVSLNTLINRLKEGRFVIPDFQREFEWEPWDIKELARSIFLDYYIGSLLLWKGKEENFDALSCEPIYGHNECSRPEYIVLDGQQRLTAMYYAFFAPDIPLPRRANRAYYFLRVDRFMEEEYDEAFYYDWLSQRISRLMNDQTIQFEEHIFPLSVVGSGGWDLPNWVQRYEQFWKDRVKRAEEEGDPTGADDAMQHAANARAFGEHLKEITEQYQISYIELDRDLAIDKVCDIFTQINSRGVRLDVFDLMNALLKPKGLQLKQMWRDAKTRTAFVGTERMNVYILQVMSILRQAYCSPKYLYFLLPGQERPVRDPDGTRHKEVLVRDTTEFEEQWNCAVDALEDAIKLLRHPQEFGAISPKYLPYVSILPAFAALQAYVKTLPVNRRLDAQRKIRHWYWASVFTNRYSGSVESTSARDFLDAKTWIEDGNAEPALILEFKTRFATLDLRREVKRGTSVYNGIFNLLVLQGARDWMTGTIPQHDDLNDHHIIPASWGEAHLQKNQVNTILNRTPLAEDTNKNFIRERLPNAYLPDLIAKNGEASVREILESHFISPVAMEILLRDPFTPDDFEEFITERQRTLQQAVESLLIKERLDLPPRLRDLDEKIEGIELGLRNLIAMALKDDPAGVPPQFLQRTEERILGAARKNPAMDIEQYQTLSKKLEYCDLRELQGIIVSRSLWSTFESHFSNKDTLNIKFNQLAELRNGIRHSRTVDEIVRKEGEAAILWFGHVLRI
jgi:hypothetical protein